MWNDNHVQKPRHLQSVQNFVFHCCLKRSLRQQTSFLQAPNGFVVIILPTGHDPEDYKRSVTDILHSKPLTWDTKEANYFYIHQRTRQEKLDGDFASEHQRTKKLLALAEDRDAITPMIKLAADVIIDLCPISARDLRAACRVVLNLNLTEAQAQDILAYPLELVWSVLRPGRSVDNILRRLLAVTESQVSRKPETAALPLSAMHGYGSAQLWGLELAEDLRDWAAGSISWSDVDKGIVLSGPPGVGKTVYARALAQECGVELVATSFSRWQATGHLGDLLRAMRSDFARAKSNAPSVLFIDELDSVGDRARFSEGQ
ncbi:AAA family ATPase [Rhizobium sp. L1K21]|uniref:AAA family ATPase n=1 Tax=Rhizobium sp. L1K21 TaxID=2954933 RepID=UPI002093370A|nr:AAA family ATPase [Rhizobium sp. L1K21]MCO6184590.1 AAA family ATPase [Rhizobium sp. L1K21]